MGQQDDLRARAPIWRAEQPLQAADLLRGALTPRGLSLLAGVFLAFHWYGGHGLLLVAGLALPGLVAARNLLGRRRRAPAAGPQLPGRAGLLAALDARIEMQGHACCHLIELDLPGADGAAVASRNAQLLPRLLARMAEPGGGRDLLARLSPQRFALVPAEARSMSPAAAIRRAADLKALLAEPVWIGPAAVRVTGWIGFATTSAPEPGTAAELLAGAETALEQALGDSPGSIRFFGAPPRSVRVQTEQLLPELGGALDSGEIRIWFQPQLSTDTGGLAGMEAVPRWLHPYHGPLAVDEFLPAIQQSPHSGQFCGLLVDSVLGALRDWTFRGAAVPLVTLTLPRGEFRDPGLADRIRWDLDRFDITPARLSLRIPAPPPRDETVLRNLRRLGDMGLRLELDCPGGTDAGLLRRLDIHRLRIPGGLDGEPDRQRDVADLVAEVERLGLATLACGIGSPAEHALAAQLGCCAVQGLGIAPPMPPEQTHGWISRNRAETEPIRLPDRRVI